MPAGKARLLSCEKCGKKHKNRTDNICNDCRALEKQKNNKYCQICKRVNNRSEDGFHKKCLKELSFDSEPLRSKAIEYINSNLDFLTYFTKNNPNLKWKCNEIYQNLKLLDGYTITIKNRSKFSTLWIPSIKVKAFEAHVVIQQKNLKRKYLELNIDDGKMKINQSDSGSFDSEHYNKLSLHIFGIAMNMIETKFNNLDGYEVDNIEPVTDSISSKT